MNGEKESDERGSVRHKWWKREWRGKKDEEKEMEEQK